MDNPNPGRWHHELNRVTVAVQYQEGRVVMPKATRPHADSLADIERAKERCARWLAT